MSAEPREWEEPVESCCRPRSCGQLKLEAGGRALSLPSTGAAAGGKAPRAESFRQQASVAATDTRGHHKGSKTQPCRLLLRCQVLWERASSGIALMANWTPSALPLLITGASASLTRLATFSRTSQEHPKASLSLLDCELHEAGLGLSPGLPASDCSDSANGAMSQISLQRESHQPKLKKRNGTPKAETGL